MMDMLVVLSGCSQSGKTTLANRLLKDKEFTKIRTATTRRRRQNESKNAYYFVQITDFKNKSKFFESEKVHGSHYGVYKKELTKKLAGNKTVLWVIDPKGACKLRTRLRKFLPKKTVFIFLHPGEKKLIERIRKKKDIDIRQRIRDIKIELKLLGKNVFDYLVDTSITENESLKLLKEIIRKEAR